MFRGQNDKALLRRKLEVRMRIEQTLEVGKPRTWYPRGHVSDSRRKKLSTLSNTTEKLRKRKTKNLVLELWSLKSLMTLSTVSDKCWEWKPDWSGFIREWERGSGSSKTRATFKSSAIRRIEKWGGCRKRMWTFCFIMRWEIYPWLCPWILFFLYLQWFSWWSHPGFWLQNTYILMIPQFIISSLDLLH